MRNMDTKCRCGCGGDIKPELKKVVDELSQSVGGFDISSGFRCVKHNESVHGVVGSAHTLGLAIDIVCDDSSFRCKLVSMAIKLGIKRIGIAKTFVHIDIDSSKSLAMWLYNS
jgi:zinc D-Ala-D-Ala carboxypeptidase